MSIWEAVTWDVARAGGFVAYILLTLSVAIGLALTLHWQSPRWPRLINSELHNFITLLALIFTCVHVTAVWLDPFTSFGWNEVLIPFASHYRPQWVALGIIALYLGLAIGLSTWLRPRIGYRWWRRLHVLTLLIFALVLVHGIATGSDTRTWWGVAIYAGSVLLVGGLLWRRLYWPANAQSRAHPVLAMVIAIAVLIGTGWTILGPLQPGWNAIANNGNGSGAANALAATNKGATKGFTPSFTGQVQGQLTQRGPDSNGNVTLQMNMAISNGPQGTVQVILIGYSTNGDDRGMSVTSSRVTLSQSNGSLLYTGTLTGLYGERSWHMQALLNGAGANSGSQLQVEINVRITQDGQCSGTIAGSAYPGGGSNSVKANSSTVGA
jgi:hypothetical protein